MTRTSRSTSSAASRSTSSAASRRTIPGGAARALVMPAAAIAVHQLRYALVYGGGAGARLRQTGHSYLHSLVPWIVLLLGLAAGAFLWALGQALSGERSRPRRTASWAALWFSCTLCLVAIFAGQELLEGLFATGHPAGLAGIFGFGGWWAVPAAAGVGLILAALFHGARWTLDEVARRRACRRIARPHSALARLAPAPVRVPRPVPVAGGWSGRGPPALY